MDWSIFLEPISVIIEIVVAAVAVIGLRRRFSSSGEPNVSNQTVAANISDSTVIQDSQINIGPDHDISNEREIEDIIELTKREIQGNSNATGYMASMLQTNMSDELQKHSRYASMPLDLRQTIDGVHRYAATQNSIGQHSSRSGASANRNNYVRLAESAIEQIDLYLERFGRMPCQFKTSEITVEAMNRIWEIEIVNESSEVISNCVVQLDDLWFADQSSGLTLDSFPTAIPLKWVGPSDSSRANIASRGKRRFELVKVVGSEMSGSLEFGYDLPEQFRSTQSLSYDDEFYVQLSVSSDEYKTEFIVVKVDPPMVKSLTRRGLAEMFAEHRPAIEFLHQETDPANRDFLSSNNAGG